MSANKHSKGGGRGGRRKREDRQKTGRKAERGMVDKELSRGIRQSKLNCLVVINNNPFQLSALPSGKPY